jgi:dTDP-4-dehydrorhamnose reductase
MKILLTSPALLESGGRLLQVSTDFVFNGQQRR